MKELLSAAIADALETGGFSKLNIVEQTDNIVLFGTGRFFEEAFEPWKLKERLHVTHLCDSNPEKWGCEMYGLPCISPAELAALPNAVAIPIVGNPWEIEAQLDAMGIAYLNITDILFEILCNMPREREWFASNRILEVYDMFEDDWSRKVYANVICQRIAPRFARATFHELFTDDEYFSHGFFPLGSEETFIDCGAYNGDTIKRFLEAVSHRFQAIHAFEMAPSNYEALVNFVSALPDSEKQKIHCHNAGVWDDDLGFSYGKEELGSGESFGVLKKENTAWARTYRLDELCETFSQGLIKMDIEGAELRALMGGRELIRLHMPKLAICLYHRLEDFWTIPVYLKSICPDYNFGIKHHQDGTLGGTVLYAW